MAVLIGFHEWVFYLMVILVIVHRKKEGKMNE